MSNIQSISPIEWWLAQCKVDELQSCPIPTKEAVINEIPSINKDGFTLCTSECASDLIHQLFNHYVDESTLVLTTNWEHPSVCECIAKCKNVKKIDITKPVDAREIYQECQKYKSVFCYMIGIANNFLYETSQTTLHIVRNILNQLSIPSIFVLDDCQGFLIRTRDWSMFDYVVTTAHAFMNLDCGVCFCRSPFYGFGELNIPNLYLGKLQQIKHLLNKIFLFNSCVQEYFSDTEIEFLRPCSPTQAVVRVKMPNVAEKLQSIGIKQASYRIDDAGQELFEQTIGFRAFKHIFDASELISQLENLKYLVQENATSRLTNTVLRLNN